MSFINNYSTIIRLSNKEMFHFKTDKNIIYDSIDENGNLISSTTVNTGKIDFSSSYFTLDKNDSIYGVYNNNNLKLLEIDKYNKTFSEKDILTYNYEKFNIQFPYIKKVDSDIHILYYVRNIASNNSCALFHHFYHNGVWTENKIDFINHIVLDNFCVIWIQNNPIIFYFNLVNGCEEVFLSRFNNITYSWSTPIQITNSNKNKIYLSVLKDNLNFYHLTFCENIDNGYAVKYINGYLTDNNFDLNISKYITGPSTSMYPSLIKNNSDLYIMWINYGKLITSISKDFGKTWGDHEIDEFSLEEDFTRAGFVSNYKADLTYSATSVFTTIDNVEILGF